MGRPKLSEKVTKYTTTLSQRDIELVKELGGSAWLRLVIGAERARLTQQMAITALFKVVRDNGYVVDLEKPLSTDFEFQGERFMATASPIYMPDLTRLEGQEKSAAVYKALQEMRVTVVRI
jgi:hypothetical protein